MDDILVLPLFQKLPLRRSKHQECILFLLYQDCRRNRILPTTENISVTMFFMKKGFKWNAIKCYYRYSIKGCEVC